VNARGRCPAFHIPAFGLSEAIAFPRELFAEVLASHSRLVEEHAVALVAAPLDHASPDDEEGDRLVPDYCMHHAAILLVREGTHVEIHRWTPPEASWAVQRCRGIVRKMMLQAPDGTAHLVVVAEGVASLHRVRSAPPKRVGEPPRAEIVERDVVVEPWDQWHQRLEGHVVTRWRTPAGDLVGSRVKARRWSRDLRHVADSLFEDYDAELRRAARGHVKTHRRDRPLVLLTSSGAGEKIDVLDRTFSSLTEGFPEIHVALHAGRPGCVPVLLDLFQWGVLRWLPIGATDVAVPDTLYSKYERGFSPYSDPEEDEEENEEKDTSWRARSRLRETCALVLGLLANAWMFVLVLLVLASIVLMVVVVVAEIGWPELGVGSSPLVPVAAGLGMAAGAHLWIWHWLLVRKDRRAPAPATSLTPPKRVHGRRYWIQRLSHRLSRLERLVLLDAPEIILESERRLVREGIAELSPGDAHAVLGAWPNAKKWLEPGAPPRPEEKPN
jgi:hypothetical protein